MNSNALENQLNSDDELLTEYITQVATYSSKTKIKIKNARFLYKKNVV